MSYRRQNSKTNGHYGLFSAYRLGGNVQCRTQAARPRCKLEEAEAYREEQEMIKATAGWQRPKHNNHLGYDTPQYPFTFGQVFGKDKEKTWNREWCILPSVWEDLRPHYRSALSGAAIKQAGLIQTCDQTMTSPAPWPHNTTSLKN